MDCRDKCDKVVDSLIQSIFSPQVISIFVIALLTYCFNENIIDTITNTQARMLLQKNKMNSFEKQIAEMWIATQNLTFLFKEFSDKQESQKSEKIDEAYKYWDALKAKWKANFSTNYDYVSTFQGERTKKYCLKNKEELFTEFEYQFKCRINKMFEEEFFNKLKNCYKNYYLRDQSCKGTLPPPQIANQLGNMINSFYLEISKSK